MKVNVLGVPYQIEIRNKENDTALINNDGYCDETIKLIVIDEMKPDHMSKKDLNSYQKFVLRHELVHAFLFESGLAEFSHNEKFVDWIAAQFPKLLAAFEQANCKGVD